MTEPTSGTAPTFVACGARSGSTLLRWLIDAHPEVACPGETEIALFLDNYVKSAATLSEAVPAAGAATAAHARAIADGLLAPYVAAKGKQRWCDKSLCNVAHLDLLAEVWPDARFIMLHRHCMDAVMSAIEAAPWGLNHYGFAKYAQASATNPVAALVAYWTERTSRMLAFEEQHPRRCLRVRYEDLVTDPELVLSRVWNLIGVEPVSDIAASAFAARHDDVGPSDHKVWFTHAVHRESLGRGARVPVQVVAAPIWETTNELLQRLGYATIGRDWGSGGPVSVVAQEIAKPAHDSLIELRVVEDYETRSRAVVDLASATWANPDGEPGFSGERRATIPRVVAIEVAALLGLCTATENVAAALRARTIRYYGPFLGPLKDERLIFEHLAEFLHGSSAEILGPDGLLSR